MVRRHSAVAFAVPVVVVVVSLIALEATVPDLGRWWRMLVAVLIALLVGVVTEWSVRRRRRPTGAGGERPR